MVCADGEGFVLGVVLGGFHVFVESHGSSGAYKASGDVAGLVAEDEALGWVSTWLLWESGSTYSSDVEKANDNGKDARGQE